MTVPNARSMRVLIVDDHPPFRRAARRVIDAMASYQVVGEATSGEEAVTLAESLRADLVLMDVKMPGIGGIEATRRIVDHSPDRLIILLSSYRREDVPAAVRSCGALAYLPKEAFGARALTGLLSRRPALD